MDLLYELSADDEVRAQYDLRRKAQLEFDSFVAEAYADGQEEGKTEVARNALAEGIPADIVSRITGLDAETVKRLPV